MNDDEYMKKAFDGKFVLSFTEMLLETFRLLKEQNPLSHMHTSNKVIDQLLIDELITVESPNIRLTEKGKELLSKIEIADTISKAKKVLRKG